MSALVLLLVVIFDTRNKFSRIVAEADGGVIGTLAVVWAGVTAVMVLSTFYAPIATSEALSYLFWYFSGVIAAQRVRGASQAE